MARVLVVEDSPTVISAVEGLLRQYGHNVYVARDGLSALASLRAFIPDIVLLDILLPHIDGIELCRLIRTREAFKAVAIAMMTGVTDQEVMNRAYEAGANHYITKPFTDHDLLMLFGEHFEKREHPNGPEAGMVL